MLHAPGLIWRLAQHPAIPGGLADVRALPARMLWQGEVLADAADRIERRRRLEAATTAAHNRALAAMKRRAS